MKKSWISALLTIMLALSMLTGCGGEQATSSQDDGSPQITDAISSDTPLISDDPEEIPQPSGEPLEDIDTPKAPAPKEPEQITSGTNSMAFSMSDVPTYSGAVLCSSQQQCALFYIQ